MNSLIVVLALVVALSLVGVVAEYFVAPIPPKVTAAGCTNGKAFNASKGRCFEH